MTKLLPSSQCLKNNLETVFHIIEKNDIHTIGELKECLKTKAKVAKFSEKTTIEDIFFTNHGSNNI